MASNQDLFCKVTGNTGWQLDASGISDDSVTSFGLVSATSLPTDTAVVLTVDRVDSSGNKTPSKMERIIGVMSGTTVTNCLRGTEGTAQAHSAGAVVEIVISKTNINKLMEGILVEHNQDGTHNNFKINAPEGFLINGKIAVSVASNNLTVAIKGMDGNDPSSTNPVYCRINSVIRSITGALSVTKNAGTNWCNAGSSELATKEIDYFVYLGYNATDGVVVGFSRIPYANQYSDFSAVTTNEKYCAISTITNAVSTDYYSVIGRFAATLSAGAGYNWSVPTFTASNLIQRPIYETRVLQYVPTAFGDGGSIGTYAQTLYSGEYKIIGNMCYINSLLKVTNVGSWSGSLRTKFPFSNANATANSHPFTGRLFSYGGMTEKAIPIASAGASACYWTNAPTGSYYATHTVNDMHSLQGFYSI